MKLDTAEKILEYFGTMDDWHSTGDYPKCESCRPYYITAEWLAYCVRVTEIVEKRVAEGASVDLVDVDYSSGGNYDDAYSMGLDHGELGALRSFLAEAAKKERK